MKHRLVAVVMLCVAIIACNAPSRPSQATPDDLQPATATLEAVASQPTNQPTQQIELPNIEGTISAISTATIDPGTPATISGEISDPSGSHPAMRIYALRTDGQRYVFVQVRANDGRYTLEVQAGEYYLLADANAGDGAFEGGYTEMSKCLRDGGSCANASHNLIAILAQAGQTIQDVDIFDWVSDGSIFPDVP